MVIFDMVRNALLAGLGAQEKLREYIDDLVKKGELSESQGAKLVREWSEKAQKNTEDVSKIINEMLTGTLEKFKFATRDDIAQVNEKIDTLTARLILLEGAPLIKDDIVKLNDKIDALGLRVSKLEGTQGGPKT